MDQKKIGAFLKALRAEKGLTQEQLAQQMQVVQPDGVPVGDRLQSARPERSADPGGLLRGGPAGASGRGTAAPDPRPGTRTAKPASPC